MPDCTTLCEYGGPCSAFSSGTLAYDHCVDSCLEDPSTAAAANQCRETTNDCQDYVDCVTEIAPDMFDTTGLPVGPNQPGNPTDDPDSTDDDADSTDDDANSPDDDTEDSGDATADE